MESLQLSAATVALRPQVHVRVARVTVRFALGSVTSFHDVTVKPYLSAHLTCDQCWKQSASDTEQCTVRAHFANMEAELC